MPTRARATARPRPRATPRDIDLTKLLNPVLDGDSSSPSLKHRLQSQPLRGQPEDPTSEAPPKQSSLGRHLTGSPSELPQKPIQWSTASRLITGHLQIPQTIMTNADAANPQPLVSALGMSSMRRCPKFNSCSAPICPLDPQWSSRSMFPSDASCTWLLEMAKGGPQSQSVPADIRPEVAAALLEVIPSVGLAPLRSRMKQAALTGSRRANAVRLHQATA